MGIRRKNFGRRGAPRPEPQYTAFLHPRPDFIAVLSSARKALEDAALDETGKPRKIGRPRKVR